MGIAKTCLLAALVVSAGFLLLGIGTLGAKPQEPNPHNPVWATDVALVPKVSLHGRRAPVKAAGQRPSGAAVGVLGEPCSGAKYAIVVGISNYAGVRNDLEYAALDAIDMAALLSEAYGFDNILLFTDSKATRANILTAIDAVRAVAHPEDEVVFFFSGHGVSGSADDGDDERVDEAIAVYSISGLQPLWDGELREAFCDFPTDRIIFIFDSCMAGGMNDLQGPGRVILMASPEKGYAYEGDEWGHGEFTYYLLEGISTGAARTYNYGISTLSGPASTTVEEAYDYAKANCIDDRPVINDSFPNDLLP